MQPLHFFKILVFFNVYGIPQRNILPIEEFVTCIRKEKYEEGYSHGDQHGFQVGKRVAEAEFQQALQG